MGWQQLGAQQQQWWQHQQTPELVGHLQKGIFNSQTDFCLSPSHLLICPSKPTYAETWKQMPLEFYACAFPQYTVCLKMYPSTMWDTCHVSYRNTHQMCIQIWFPEGFWPNTTGQNRELSWHFLSTSLGDGSAALLSHGHKDSFTLKTLTYGSWQDLCTVHWGCSLKWSQSKVKSWESAFEQVPEGWSALRSLTVHESHGPWTWLADT